MRSFCNGVPLNTLKALCDKALLLSAEELEEAGEVLQVHTGLGAPLAGPELVRPGLLVQALRKTVLGHVRLVLLHAGWPYSEEAGWLANSFSNVWVDTSLVTLMRPDRLADILWRLFATAPQNKVLYGSDGHTDPVSLLIALWQAKQAIAVLMEHWLSEGYSLDALWELASEYFAATASLLYGTGHGGPI
jgi:predicted TIM-barrel fold metal-dependent hydrolase